MSSIGFGEIVLILLVAIVVIKPEQLPYVAQQCGRRIRWLRNLLLAHKAQLNSFIGGVDQKPNKEDSNG